MKMRRWGWIGLVLLASACGANQDVANSIADVSPAPPAESAESAQEPAIPVSCGPMDSQVPLQPDADGALPFERFDFRPTQVDATETTLTFKSGRYSFTFCKGDRTWGIQTLETATETEDDYATYFEAIADPEYEPVASNEQTYRARVRLDASWLDNQKESTEDLEQVIFDLVKPGNSETVSQVLYTNTEILERELGASAGVPEITGSFATEEALWWSIGFEQGEGASGITTLVQYKIDTDELVLWQPSALGNAQVTHLAVTGTGDDPTLWLGTQYSGEGNPYLPAEGLVAYRPATDTIQPYTVENSPLLGAIPTRLWLEDEDLWVATASGICEVDWAAIDSIDSWACWQFSTMADLPAGRPLYGSLLAESPMDTLDSAGPVELLWVTDTDISTPEATLRYEISYAPGITAQLDQGAEYYVYPESQPDEGYFWWPGQYWSWNGQRFVRHRDQVAMNYVGGGPQGIGPGDYENYIVNWNAMRGEFDLLELTPESTEIKYYSAWTNGDGVEPWLTMTAVDNTPLAEADPTDKVLTELKQGADSTTE